MGFEWTTGSADYSYDSAVTFPDALAELFARESGFERSLRAAPNQPRFAVFASQRWRLGERWMPEIGLRVQEIHVGAMRERPGIRASAFVGKCGHAPDCVSTGAVFTRPTKCTSWPSPMV